MIGKKTRVLVLYGGRSAEHEVSLQSAAFVIQHLDPARFEILPVVINKQGHWLSKDISKLPLKEKDILQQFDVIFPVLHGPLGEDGTIQGLFELVDVPYVGPGVLSSAVAMDKSVAKRLMQAADLPVVPHLTIKLGQWQKQPQHYLQLVAAQLGYPVFVKPANLGSSIGIFKVKNPAQLSEAISAAFQYDTKILVEKAINAREVEVAVLENAQYGEMPLTSIPGEIVPSHEFYSYEAKYLDVNGADLVIPADLSAQQVTRAQQLAAKTFEILECEGMARVDFLLDKDTSDLYVSEANTIPGFTSISMYPKLWEASGLNYTRLLNTLVELAIARHERKRAIKRDWT